MIKFKIYYSRKDQRLGTLVFLFLLYLKKLEKLEKLELNYKRKKCL